ncbi:hypothetical protein EK21DRAFT_95679, partial [Setomelanomma holmii]
RRRSRKPPTPQPIKRRGRPAKTVATAEVAPAKKSAISKTVPAKVSKPAAPRKRRGITILDFPDKSATQMRQFLQQLQEAELLPLSNEDTAEEQLTAEAEVDTDAVAEEDAGQSVEEDILITSATAVADEENAPFVDASEESVLTELVQEVVVREYEDEEIDEDSTDAAAGLDLEISVQEVVQIERRSNDLDATEQDLKATTEIHEELSTSILSGDTDASVREAEARPSAAAIFHCTCSRIFARAKEKRSETASVLDWLYKASSSDLLWLLDSGHGIYSILLRWSGIMRRGGWASAQPAGAHL